MMYAALLGMILHGLFGLAMFIGLVCGVIWLARFASKEQLKRWFKWLFLIGLLGALLTCPWAHRGMYKMMDRWDDKESGEYGDDEEYGSMGDAMEDMMDWDEDDSADQSENVTTPVEDNDETTTQSTTAPENTTNVGENATVDL